MQSSSPKEEILKAVRDLPPEADIADAMERLYLLYKIRKGLEQADKGDMVSHEEAKKHLKAWLE